MKISLIYALVGGLWILLSDELLSVFVKDPSVITRLEIFKGWFFIGTTALMLYLLIRHNIERVRKSEQALRESEEKFQMLVETTASAIFIYRERILHVNHAMEVLTGYAKEELLAMSYHDFVHPDYGEKIRQHCEALFTREALPLRCEYRIVTKNGEERWVDFTASIINYDGEPAGLGTAFDITERKKTEEALKESEDRFRLLIENVTDYEIFMLDQSGHIVVWNVGAELSKGYRPDEVIGKHHSIFFTDEDVKRGLPEFELKMASEKSAFEDEGWRVRKDGSLFWADVVTTALWDKERNLRGFSKVIRDVTDRKIAEEKLKESEERYRVIAVTASDAIITIDENSVILFANPAVKKIFGYATDEIVGQNLSLLIPERLRKGHFTAMKRFTETGERHIKWESIELPGLHREGHDIPLEISYGEFLREGKYFFTGIVRDITERKQAEKEKEYKDMLERFNQELEILVSERTMNLMALRLADRVRTPASIIGWTGKRILARGDISEKSKEGITTIISEADKLEAIVRDFHSLLKSRTPAFSYEDMNEIVRGVLSIVEREAVRKGQEIIVNLSDLPLKVNVQKDLLRMAIFNMLRNAIETTGEGGRITVATEGVMDKVVLAISDTGRGIPAETLDKIFDPLYSTGIYRFGMGLPLVKQIVTEHLGEIEVQSETGKGTTLRVLLPVRWTEKPGGEEKLPQGKKTVS